MNMKIRLAAVLAGFILDLLFGDPHCLPHPVRAIGGLITGVEKKMRKIFPPGEKGERTAGFVLTVLVLFVVGGVSALICGAAAGGGYYINFLIQTILCYYLLAARSLLGESMKVCTFLEAGDVEGARKSVSMIVGRDTAQLTDVEIAKAAVETVAENTSDGVIAPLFYLALGGPVLGWLYKAVNTMDSMVGYRNEKYLNFGRAAARLDDLVNLIPARLSAWLMIAAAFFLRLDARNALRIYKRDRYNHKSPNSAHTEAVCAGALGVELAGDAWYFGQRHEKPTIGDPRREVTYGDIKKANQLMYLTAVLCLFFAAAGLIFI